MCAVTGVVTASGSAVGLAWLEAVARVLTVAVPIARGPLRAAAAAVRALRRAAGRRGLRLVPHHAGERRGRDALQHRAASSGWVFEPLLIYLLLAFPTGRLDSRLDRALVWIAVVLVLVLYLPTALLVERYPVPSPVDDAATPAVPANAFMVSGSEPAVIEDLVRPLREILTIALFAAVAVRLAQRIRGATPPHAPRARARAGRRVLSLRGLRRRPPRAAARARRPASSTSSVWLLALAVPLMAVAFLVGPRALVAVHRRSTQRLAARLRAHPTPEDLRARARRGVRRSVADDRVLARRRRGALGRRGRAPARSAGGRARSRRDGDRRRRPPGRGDRPRRRAARTTARSSTRRRRYALMTLDNHRLSAQTSSLLRAVRESRARIQAAADDERRRIERDLHDGAQQRLVALRIKLELAAERTGDGHGNGAEGAAVLRGLGGDVEDGARGGPLAGARHLSRVARRPRARRGAARGGAAQPASDHGPRGRRPPPLARDRERRLLLLPGGAAERGQARARARAPR